MMKNTKLAVMNFIHCGDEYLFLRRSLDKEDDPGKVNAIGGKMELGETIVEANIRETKEETGLSITSEQPKFLGTLKIEGEVYSSYWMHFLFKTNVSSKEVPVGNVIDEGELLWIHKDQLLAGEYDVVDDLYYTFKDIVENRMFSGVAVIGGDEKVVKYKKDYLQNR